jgi:hypothetical protein
VGELVIVTGPPGSGKSTVCDLLVEKFDSSVLVHGDWFFGLWRRGAIDPWLPEARAQANVAGNAAAATAGIFARSDCLVVYDGVVRPDFADAELPARHLIADAGATPGDQAEIILNGLNDGGFLWKVAY